MTSVFQRSLSQHKASINLDCCFSMSPNSHVHFSESLLQPFRWKKSQIDRSDMSYCRKHFLNRTALITIEVTTSSHSLGCKNHSSVLNLPLLTLLSPPSPPPPTHWPPGCQTGADEDDGAGRLLLPSLLLQVSAAAAVQAADLGAERGADGWPLRQRGPRPVHALRGRAGAGGVHGGDTSRQSSGAPVVRQPTPADARLAAVPGEGAKSGGKCTCVQNVLGFWSDC